METARKGMNDSLKSKQGEVGIETREMRFFYFLREAFICVSIPVIVYTFAYLTLNAIIRLFL